MKRKKQFKIVEEGGVFYIEEFTRYWFSFFNGWSRLGSWCPSGSSSMSDDYFWSDYTFRSREEATTYLERNFINYELL